MKFMMSSILQLLLFGCLDGFLFAKGASQPLPVILLFVVLELGVMASLCSLIFDQMQRTRPSETLMTVVVGFIASHIAILMVLEAVAPYGLDAVSAPRNVTLAWMELTMQVGLVAILAVTAVVALNPKIERRRNPNIHRGPFERRGT